MEDSVCLQAAQGDDPWLVFLTDEYVCKICFLHDIAERHKLYRVRNIAYWTSTKTRFANWEATLEPIHMSTDGEFYVDDKDVIVGPKGIRLTKSKVLLGYIVVTTAVETTRHAGTAQAKSWSKEKKCLELDLTKGKEREGKQISAFAFMYWL